MKTAKLLVALLVVGASLATLSPAAEARNVCSRVLDGPTCPGHACQWRQPGYWYCEKDILQEICFPCWEVLP